MSNTSRHAVALGTPGETHANTIVLGGATIVIPLEMDPDHDPLHDDEVRLWSAHGGYDRTMFVSEHGAHFQAGDGIEAVELVRTLLPALRGLNPAVRETAAVLGATPWRVWREVELPIVGRAVLVGAPRRHRRHEERCGRRSSQRKPSLHQPPPPRFPRDGQTGQENGGVGQRDQSRGAIHPNYIR